MKSMFAWAGALVGALASLGRINSRSLQEPVAIRQTVTLAPPYDVPFPGTFSWSSRHWANPSDGIPAFPHRRSYLASRREARRRRNIKRGGR